MFRPYGTAREEHPRHGAGPSRLRAGPSRLRAGRMPAVRNRGKPLGKPTEISDLRLEISEGEDGGPRDSPEAWVIGRESPPLSTKGGAPRLRAGRMPAVRNRAKPLANLQRFQI